MAAIVTARCIGRRALVHAVAIRSNMAGWTAAASARAAEIAAAHQRTSPPRRTRMQPARANGIANANPNSLPDGGRISSPRSNRSNEVNGGTLYLAILYGGCAAGSRRWPTSISFRDEMRCGLGAQLLCPCRSYTPVVHPSVASYQARPGVAGNAAAGKPETRQPRISSTYRLPRIVRWATISQCKL